MLEATIQSPFSVTGIIVNAQNLGTVFPRRKIKLYCNTQNSGVRFSTDRTSLESPPPLVRSSGILVTNSFGPVEAEWEGELWAIGDPANTGPVSIAVIG